MAANTKYPQTNTQIEESNNYIKKNLAAAAAAAHASIVMLKKFSKPGFNST